MKQFETLLAKVKEYNPQADLELIKQAFELAEKAHAQHKRLSGEPYITHPLAVALILAGLEQDIKTIAAALLHDVIEDTDIDHEQLTKKFDKEVARLVEGVSKLSQLTFISKEVRQAENFRKMFVAMSQDFRIIIIKLADRLHNMQTLEFLPPPQQKETALETREIFAPLAHRLGMWKLKWELEDLSFAYLEPDKYEEIKHRVAESRGRREEYIQAFISDSSKLLDKVAIEGYIYGRPKHFYSIYHKMVDQNLEFDEIYDLTAVRMIVESVKECYAILGLIHAAWRPIPGRFRDYIAMAKSNGYQSLHTTVIGPQGRPVEVQIRTKEMHRIAEYGIAAHWRYKEGATDQNLDQKMAWFREMLEWQGELKDAKDFMESLKTDLFIDEVFVFTPNGDVFDLPNGATPVDFAYRVHTEVGHRAVGAKVNGRIVPLHFSLSNGDIIEILTGKKDNPSRDWLRIVKTAGARVKIRNWFKKHQPLPVGEEEKAEKAVEDKKPRPQVSLKPRLNSKSAVEVEGLENVQVRFSKCCKPIPGEAIVGFVSHGRGVAIHRADCDNITKAEVVPEKKVAVSWSLKAQAQFPVDIEIEAYDRVGVLKDILGEISETKTNVPAAKITTKRGSSAFLKVTVDVRDLEHLNQVIAAIQKVSDVYEVRR
ncbi:MAG: bifunctional (p)ppGpp synthetase/guanosine-3',5'-bis(diphosphate) 3'-pyrophosphohydrolase [bacterium]